MTSVTPVKLAYSSYEPDGGASDQPPIIFCHGLTSSKEQWVTIPKTVAEATKRKVYAIDARNHGDTEWSDVFNFDANINDLLHFMDSIGAKKITVVGHSMGGATAMLLALRMPELIASIVVEDMSCSKLPPEISGMINMFLALGAAALESLPAGTSEQDAKRSMFEKLLTTLPPEMAVMVKRESMENIQLRRLEDGRLALKSNMQVIKDTLKKEGHLTPEYKGRYEGPACFIYGTLSPFNVGGEVQRIKEHFPRAELVPIENASHVVHADHKEEYVEALLKFLSQ